MSKRRARKQIIKLAGLRNPISESDEWRICTMGTSGFAWRYIASHVLRDDSDTGMRRVGSVLKRNEIKVTEYRRGITEEAQGVVRRILNKKAQKTHAKGS